MKGFNPESRAFARSETKLPEAEEALYDVLVPQNKERAIQLDEFADLYDPKIIEQDKLFIKNLDEKWRRADSENAMESAGKFSELFEAIINDQIENSDLMGPNADVIVPSRFDDAVNGVDSIVRFKGEKGATSHMALAIDVTKEKVQIGKKFDKIRASIESGELSKIKYFKSKNFRGELKPVARVIIGADHAVTDNISDLMLRFLRMKKAIAESRRTQSDQGAEKELPQKLSEVRKKLANHPLHQIVLVEIRTQLEAFQAYAQRLGKQTAAYEYAKILHVISDIIDEKDSPSNIEKNEMVDNDAVFQLIVQNAKTFK